MKIGEKYWVTPTFAGGSHGLSETEQKGKVVWVHPKGRYAVLQFDGKHGFPRECYHPEELTRRAA